MLFPPKKNAPSSSHTNNILRHFILCDYFHQMFDNATSHCAIICTFAENISQMTFTFELNSKPNAAGKYVVYLRITENRKHKRIKTTVALDKKTDWNQKKKEVRSSCPDAALLNERLKRELDSVLNKYQDCKDEGTATTDRVIEKIESIEHPVSFLEYAKRRTQEVHDAGGIRNWKKYVGFCNKLEVFLTDNKGNVRDLSFSELTTPFVAQFEAYLHTLHNERQPEKMLHPNSIQVIMKAFRAIVNRAIEVDKIIPMDKNPFLTYKLKGVETTKDKLDQSEIESIKALDLPEGSLIWHCRNYFLFSFYCAGIRVGDLIQLRWGNITKDGRIEYKMTKNHKERDFALVEPAKKILSYYHKKSVKATDYIFPVLDPTETWCRAITLEEKDVLPAEEKEKMYTRIGAKTALINKELKRIANMAGIEKKISFHVSRHSFAKAAKKKGVDNLKVQELFAHSSLKVTEGYMGHFESAENDAALASVFEDGAKKVDLDVLATQLNSLTKRQFNQLMKKVKHYKP